MRHPLDPEPVRDSKTTVVLALGVMAALTGPFVGGLVPATLALVLARDCLLYTSPSPRDRQKTRMPSSA